MTDTETMESQETPQKTVRTYRHEALNLLREAQGQVPEAPYIGYQERDKRGYDWMHPLTAARKALNGAISEILRGRSGLSQEQQVEHLKAALDKATAGLEVVNDALASNDAQAALEQAKEQQVARTQAKLDEAKARVTKYEERLASLTGDGGGVATAVADKVAQAVSTLDEAATYAAERDFEAHQAAKGRGRRW